LWGYTGCHVTIWRCDGTLGHWGNGLVGVGFSAVCGGVQSSTCDSGASFSLGSSSLSLADPLLSCSLSIVVTSIGSMAVVVVVESYKTIVAVSDCVIVICFISGLSSNKLGEPRSHLT
jgi:hypothetical protein